MTGIRPRAIFDCNIFFQAYLTPHGPAWSCVRLAEDRQVTLLLSAEIVAEARDVLNRPFVLERYPHVTAAGIDSFLRELSYIAEFRRLVPHVFSYDRDPDDEPYLNLAIAADADYLVTRDKDMHALATDHSTDAKHFRQLTHNRLQILTPLAFLANVRERLR